MSLIPPTATCPPNECHEVLQVCWADGNGNVSGCATVPAGVITGNHPQISLEDTMLITGALWGAIALAFAARMMSKPLVK